MSFLEPLLLIGLPLAALPILIHLINQRRFQNIEWGAMRFLLEANRMSRGYARIRQWLILLFRTLAVAAIIFAIARPLARGTLGLMGGGRADTTLILLDRSASMNQRGPGSVASKIETGVQQLAQTLMTLGDSRWVLIDSVSLAPQELTSPEALVNSARSEGTSGSADLPALLQAAHDYIRANRTGQTEIWICSDLRTNDWNAASSRWSTLRDAFRELPQGVRFHLLAYPDEGAGNVAVRVSDVRRQETSAGSSLILSLALTRTGGEGKLELPVQVEIEGARSEITVEMEGEDFALEEHPVPLEGEKTEGWGRISIPADANAADNEFYFVFADPPKRRTILVTDDETAGRPLMLASAISPNTIEADAAEIVAPSKLAATAWDDVALVVWNAPLPKGGDAKLMQSLVDRGGQILFLPPPNPDTTEFAGVAWTDWKTPAEPVAAADWRGDQDLLARTRSGSALPVGELLLTRYCELKGEVTPLATLSGGAPLLARATTPTGGVYFLATTAATSDSSLATNGVVLYALVQRALEAGTVSLSHAQQALAGPTTTNVADWRQIAGADDALSMEYPYHAGAYGVGDRLVAVNRSDAEDLAGALADERVAELFQGLDFDRVDDEAGNVNSLAREVWRVFLICMVIALLVEAALCLPKRPKLAEAFA
jgi:hypothetical protein